MCGEVSFRAIHSRASPAGRPMRLCVGGRHRREEEGCVVDITMRAGVYCRGNQADVL